MADHGEGFGEHGLRQHDNTIYDEGIKVPYLVYDPSDRRGRSVQRAGDHDERARHHRGVAGLPADRWTDPGGLAATPTTPVIPVRVACSADNRCLAQIDGSHEVRPPLRQPARRGVRPGRRPGGAAQPDRRRRSASGARRCAPTCCTGAARSGPTTPPTAPADRRSHDRPVRMVVGESPKPLDLLDSHNCSTQSDRGPRRTYERQPAEFLVDPDPGALRPRAGGDRRDAGRQATAAAGRRGRRRTARAVGRCSTTSPRRPGPSRRSWTPPTWSAPRVHARGVLPRASTGR